MLKKILSLFLILLLVLGGIALSKDISKRIQNIGIIQDHYDILYAKEMFEAINEYRQEENLHEYVWYETLEEAARIRAKEISVVMSHERPDGTPFYTVHDEAYGENIAKGFPNVEKVMIGFMDSPSHRDAILSKDYYYVTCAVYYSGGIYYYVQLFR